MILVHALEHDQAVRPVIMKQEPQFVFIAHLLHVVLGFLQSPNRLFQAKMTDLVSHVELIESSILAETTLGTDDRFEDLLTTPRAKLAMQSHELGPKQKCPKVNGK